MKNSKLYGDLLLLLVAFIWGGGFVLALIVLHETVTVQILFGCVLVFVGVIVSKLELKRG